MIERFALSFLLAAALAAPAAAGEAVKPSGAEEALKFEISFEKDKLIEKCAGGGVGAKCGSATFQLGKKDAKKKCVEFGELKHSQVDKLDEEFVKEISAEKKIAEKADWGKLDEKEKRAAKKMAFLYAAHDSLDKELKAAEADPKKPEAAKAEYKKLGCGGLKKIKKALAAEISKCEKAQGKSYKSLKCPSKPEPIED